MPDHHPRQGFLDLTAHFACFQAGALYPATAKINPKISLKNSERQRVWTIS
jgi:hypothetical protein